MGLPCKLTASFLLPLLRSSDFWQFYYNASWRRSRWVSCLMAYELYKLGCTNLPRFGTFSAIIFLNKLSSHPSLSPSSETAIIFKLLLLMVFHRSINFLYSLSFFYFAPLDWITARSCLILSSIFLLFHPFWCWCYVLHFFYFIHCILQLQNFCLVLFYSIQLLNSFVCV